MADGGLPPGFEVEFSVVGPILESAAQRQGRRIRELSNMEAAVLLRQQKALGEKHAKEVKTLADQFLRAAGDATSASTSPACGVLFTQDRRPGRDAEEKEGARWVEILGSLLVHTPTPMGRILGERPGGIQLVGAGRRASTLRSRVRAVRRYLNWLALNHDHGYPRELDHVTGYIGSAIRALHEERVAGVLTRQSRSRRTLESNSRRS